MKDMFVIVVLAATMFALSYSVPPTCKDKNKVSAEDFTVKPKSGAAKIANNTYDASGGYVKAKHDNRVRVSFRLKKTNGKGNVFFKLTRLGVKFSTEGAFMKTRIITAKGNERLVHTDQLFNTTEKVKYFHQPNFDQKADVLVVQLYCLDDSLEAFDGMCKFEVIKMDACMT